MATNISIYLSFLLRHRPDVLGLDMDRHGWVSVDALLAGIRAEGRFRLDLPMLEQIVRTDAKGRYRFNEDHTRIKACQGHSVSWVEPELEFLPPPDVLYHGTTVDAAREIMRSGAICKMTRHAVHLQAEPEKAWKSAVRWKRNPVLLKIDARAMHEAGFVFGRSENDVWCTQSVPVDYIVEQIKDPAVFRGQT